MQDGSYKMAQNFKDPAGMIAESPTVTLYMVYGSIVKMMAIHPEAAMWMMALTVIGYLEESTGKPFVVHAPDCDCEDK